MPSYLASVRLHYVLQKRQVHKLMGFEPKELPRHPKWLLRLCGQVRFSFTVFVVDDSVCEQPFAVDTSKIYR